MRKWFRSARLFGTTLTLFLLLLLWYPRYGEVRYGQVTLGVVSKINHPFYILVL